LLAFQFAAKPDALGDTCGCGLRLDRFHAVKVEYAPNDVEVYVAPFGDETGHGVDRAIDPSPRCHDAERDDASGADRVAPIQRRRLDVGADRHHVDALTRCGHAAGEGVCSARARDRDAIGLHKRATITQTEQGRFPGCFDGVGTGGVKRFMHHEGASDPRRARRNQCGERHGRARTIEKRRIFDDQRIGPLRP